MIFSPRTKENLFSLEIMGGFFSQNCRSFFGADELTDIKILPQKRIAKNIVILYELVLRENGKKIKKRVWGKTMPKKIFQLFNFFSKTKARNCVPKYFKYIDPLSFSLSEDVGGKTVREFDKNIAFWEKNIGKIGILLATLQKAGIPRNILKNYSKKDEERFMEDSLKKIKKYSVSAGDNYGILAGKYLHLAQKCFGGKNFIFSHFDFQPSNILYNKAQRSFYVLDFDLTKNFHPALDPANFSVHIYVMIRYRYAEEKAKKIAGLFLDSYLSNSQFKKSELKRCLDIFKLRAVTDIAQMTANTFKKPSRDSRKVFKILNEILSGHLKN